MAISKYHRLTGASKLNAAMFLGNAMSLPSFCLNFSGLCVCGGDLMEDPGVCVCGL